MDNCYERGGRADIESDSKRRRHRTVFFRRRETRCIELRWAARLALAVD
jgi:hypothetical protein